MLQHLAAAGRVTGKRVSDIETDWFWARSRAGHQL